MLLGKAKARVMTTRPITSMVKRVTRSCIFLLFGNLRMSLLTLKPTKDRKVDADDSPAAKMPHTSSAPTMVGTSFMAAQMMTLSAGSMLGLLRLTMVAQNVVTRYSSSMVIAAPQAERMTTCSLFAIK